MNNRNTVDIINDLNRYESQFKNVVNETIYKPIKVAIYPFSDEQIVNVLATQGTSTITFNGVKYVVNQITKNLINQFKTLPQEIYKNLTNISSEVYNKLSIIGTQFIYTADNGDQTEIKNKEDLNNL